MKAGFSRKVLSKILIVRNILALHPARLKAVFFDL